MKRILLSVLLVGALSTATLTTLYLNDVVQHTEQDAHAWPWDGKGEAWNCAAGWAAFGFGVISGAKYISDPDAVTDHPQWLFLYTTEILVGGAEIVHGCIKDLQRTKYNIRNFCVQGAGDRGQFYRVSTTKQYWAPAVGWFSIEISAWFAYECGGYTGYGYNGGPNDGGSWPSPDLVRAIYGS